MVRLAAAAGSFYEADQKKLREQVESCFFAQNGPGDLPVSKPVKDVMAAVVPHAGYFFSGACAAWAYKDIAESKKPVSFIILGPNHYGEGSGLSITDWKTPLGMAKVNKELVIKIKENTDLEIKEHNHVHEHSIEVQLPFLQYLYESFSFVPIVVGRDLDYKKLASDLKECLKGEKVVFIVSSDFTHYGSSYNYVPFTLDVHKRIRQLDKGAIDLIMNKDSNGFKDYINKTGITICGYMHILVLLEILENETSELLMHYTSADILGDYKSSVSYAAITFSRKSS